MLIIDKLLNMETASIQQLFFQQIKGNMPGHLAMVDEVAGVLNISNDSAYRRIRAEKPISFEELQKLCSHYKISLDKFLHLQSDSFIFEGKLKGDTGDVFDDWMQDVQQKFSFFNSYDKKHMYYLMKDIPPFIHFLVPELAKFKFYFWTKSILHYDNMKGVKFWLNDERYDRYLDTSRKIIDLYNRIPITEIWNVESINSSLRQIEFYREAGAFKVREDILVLYSKLEDLINHIEKQAEFGVKFPYAQEPKSSSVEYNMFVNELILGDNTVMADLNGTRITFLNHGVLYFVATRDERFNNVMNENMENLVKKSTMISAVGEKERVRFFNQLRDRIHLYQSMVK